jgi:hypothetical protein
MRNESLHNRIEDCCGQRPLDRNNSTYQEGHGDHQTWSNAKSVLQRIWQGPAESLGASDRGQLESPSEVNRFAEGGKVKVRRIQGLVQAEKRDGIMRRTKWQEVASGD